MSTVAPDRETPSAPAGEPSSLAVARTRRRLTMEGAAERASLTPEAVEVLEESRLYRFSSLREAVAATILYSAALGISQREAQGLAGLPTRDRLLESSAPARLVALGAFVAAIALLVWFVVVPRFGEETSVEPVAAEPEILLPAPELPAPLPEHSDIDVDVLNGTTAELAARRVADTVSELSYGVGRIENATRTDYPETRVFYTPGSSAIAERLAFDLGVGILELPSGDEPLRLIVIVGAEGPLD